MCVDWGIDNAVDRKSFKILLEYASTHKRKFKHLKTLSFEGNQLTDYDIATFCRAVKKGAYKNISTLNLKSKI